MIRLRLQEFLTKDLLAEEQPSDAELQEYLEKHLYGFREEQRFRE